MKNKINQKAKQRIKSMILACLAVASLGLTMIAVQQRSQAEDRLMPLWRAGDPPAAVKAFLKAVKGLTPTHAVALPGRNPDEPASKILKKKGKFEGLKLRNTGGDTAITAFKPKGKLLTAPKEKLKKFPPLKFRKTDRGLKVKTQDGFKFRKDGGPTKDKVKANKVLSAKGKRQSFKVDFKTDRKIVAKDGGAKLAPKASIKSTKPKMEKFGRKVKDAKRAGDGSVRQAFSGVKKDDGKKKPGVFVKEVGVARNVVKAFEVKRLDSIHLSDAAN